MKRYLDRLLGTQVLVRTGSVNYRGVLKEVTEDQVSLQAPTGWREIPMDRVVDIRPFDRVGNRQ